MHPFFYDIFLITLYRGLIKKDIAKFPIKDKISKGIPTKYQEIIPSKFNPYIIACPGVYSRPKIMPCKEQNTVAKMNFNLSGAPLGTIIISAQRGNQT